MIDSNDGGVDITVNGGETWYAPPLPIAQFYHVGVRQPRALPRHRHHAGHRHRLRPEQQPVVRRHPPRRLALASAAARPASPRPTRPIPTSSTPASTAATSRATTTARARPATSASIRTTPPATAPRTCATASSGPRRSWFRRTTARPSTTPPTCCSAPPTAARPGQPISPDLTRNDKTKQKWSGGPITGDNTGVEVYGTIFAIAESPKEKGLLWAGSDDGLVHVIATTAARWENVTKNIPGLPEWGTVACIEPSPFDAATAYVVVDNHRLDDAKPYLFKTADFGKTWKKLSATGLPQDVYLHAVREDPKAAGAALPRQRARRRFFGQRRRHLAAAEAQPADRRRHRPGRQGQRPRRRHQRPVDLDLRRPDTHPRAARLADQAREGLAEGGVARR